MNNYDRQQFFAVHFTEKVTSVCTFFSGTAWIRGGDHYTVSHGDVPIRHGMMVASAQYFKSFRTPPLGAEADDRSEFSSSPRWRKHHENYQKKRDRKMGLSFHIYVQKSLVIK